MLIDAHAHLTDPTFRNDLPELLKRAQEAGVVAIVNICTDPEEVAFGLRLKQEFPWIYTVASTTPHDAEKEGEKHFAQMEQYAASGALVAIGETGLDYYHYSHTKEIQKYFLRKYLQMAKHCGLPIVIHCREAFEDLFKILDEEYQGLPGVLHCFTGTIAEAEEVIKRGWYVSFSGIVTFKKSIELQEVAKNIPLDRLLIETDAPYLAPLPFRSKRNEPAFLIETAKCVATLRGIPLTTLASATSENARALFRI
jgi:TatD DNase family protein